TVSLLKSISRCFSSSGCRHCDTAPQPSSSTLPPKVIFIYCSLADIVLETRRRTVHEKSPHANAYRWRVLGYVWDISRGGGNTTPYHWAAIGRPLSLAWLVIVPRVSEPIMTPASSFR